MPIAAASFFWSLFWLMIYKTSEDSASLQNLIEAFAHDDRPHFIGPASRTAEFLMVKAFTVTHQQLSALVLVKRPIMSACMSGKYSN